MDRIPRAEEFLNNFSFRAGQYIGNRDFETMEKYAIEFAKLHVEAALRAKFEAMRPYIEEGGWGVDELDAFSKYSYPLDNIK
jgi:hypothetical protein